jgi:CBS domain-containing protein
MPTVADILTHKGHEVVTVSPQTTVVDAARRMNEAGIGGVVVLADRDVVGIFTERDVLRRVVAEGRDPMSTSVSDVMTTEVVTVRPDAPLAGCSSLVTAKRIRHIPVVNDQGLCGIVTSGDLLAHQSREQQDTIDYLNSYVHDLR